MDFLDAVKAGAYDEVEASLKLDSSVASVGDGEVSALLTALYYRQDRVAHLIRSYLSVVSIFEAAALGEIETIEGLLLQSPELVHAVSADGFTGLTLAAHFGHLEAVRLFLDAGADLNIVSTGEIRVAPLHAALSNGFLEVARYLIGRGSDVNMASNGGWRALHYAADLGDSQLARELVAAGADPGLRTDDGLTAAELGVQVGHENVSEVL